MGAKGHRGRRGLRTAAMVAVARERMEGLVSLSQISVDRPRSTRYVMLARRIAMRYNVRMSRTMKMSYCHACSSFTGSGTAIRARLNHGCLSRTCLRCGQVSRLRYAHEREGSIPIDLREGREGGPVVVEESGEEAEEEEDP